MDLGQLETLVELGYQVLLEGLVLLEQLVHAVQQDRLAPLGSRAFREQLDLLEALVPKAFQAPLAQLGRQGELEAQGSPGQLE